MKSFKADVLSVGPLSKEMEELWVVCMLIGRKIGVTLLVVTRKTRVN